jgi:hypothetical protein
MRDMNNISAYGLWSLVIINSLIFIIFAFSFTKPNNPRDWRSFGAFSAFVIAFSLKCTGFLSRFTYFQGGCKPASQASIFSPMMPDITGMERRSALEPDPYSQQRIDFRGTDLFG